MKKALLISVLCLLVGLLKAQVSFKVPAIPDSVKHGRMVFQANGFILNSINYAKSLGKTVEDVASFTGEQFKYSWRKESGFAGFVNGTLYNWSCFIPKADIEILEQSNDMIAFRTAIIFPNLKMNGPQFNVTYDEYLLFLRIVHEKIAEYLGVEYSQTSTDEGMLITIRRK